MATGVDPISIGVLTRPDGTKQLTIAGWPQYTSKPRTRRAGDLKGQGKGGVWFVTAPNGAKITGGKPQNNCKRAARRAVPDDTAQTPSSAPPPAAPGY